MTLQNRKGKGSGAVVWLWSSTRQSPHYSSLQNYFFLHNHFLLSHTMPIKRLIGLACLISKDDLFQGFEAATIKAWSPQSWHFVLGKNYCKQSADFRECNGMYMKDLVRKTWQSGALKHLKLRIKQSKNASGARGGTLFGDFWQHFGEGERLKSWLFQCMAVVKMDFFVKFRLRSCFIQRRLSFINSLLIKNHWVNLFWPFPTI